jgi:ABC-2 type transport system permease protein
MLEPPANWLAEYNPLSYIADGMRDPIISSVSATPVLEGLGAAAGLAAVAVGLAVLSLHGRLRQA